MRVVDWRRPGTRRCGRGFHGDRDRGLCGGPGLGQQIEQAPQAVGVVADASLGHFPAA